MPINYFTLQFSFSFLNLVSSLLLSWDFVD